MALFNFSQQEIRNDGLWRYLPQRPKAWFVLGWLIFSWALLTQIPVHWGAKALTHGTGLGLSGLTGSAFNGRAANASASINGKQYPLGALTWQFKWGSIFTLKPCLAITTSLARQEFNGDVCVGVGNRLSLHNVELGLPLVVVKDLIPLNVDGYVSGTVKLLEVSDQQLRKIDASLSWSEARAFNGSSWMEMGAFGINAAHVQDAINLKVVSLQGPIDADLDVNLAHVGGAQIKGNLEMAKSFIDATNAAGLLVMLGQEEKLENGRVRYAVDTNL